MTDIEPIYSTTGHRPGCVFWGGDPTGECYCFDDDEPDDDFWDEDEELRT
jgi:hypothetical protein